MLFLFAFLSSCGESFCRPLHLKLDWSRFAYDAENGLFEIYYSFSQEDLIYQKANENYAGYVIGDFKIFHSDTLFNQYFWKTQYTAEDTVGDQSTHMFIDQVNFKIPEGKYQCVFQLWDINQKNNIDSVDFDISIFSDNADSLYFSDIELARSIEKSMSTGNSPFYKNYLIVEPNPTRFYHSDLAKLYFYTELYGLSDRIDQQSSIQYFVTNDFKQAVTDTIKRKRSELRERPSNVETGFVDLDSLSSGIYFLHVRLIDSLDTVLAEKQKEFAFYQSKQDSSIFADYTEMQFFKSMFNQMDSTNVVEEYESITYLLNEATRGVWKAATTLNLKRRFLFLFWNQNNPDPEKSANAWRLEYLSRIRYGDEHFGAMGMRGSKTDRGRVYAIYGAPSYIDRFPNEPNLHPYQIWQYPNIEKGVIFVFADLEGFRRYQLIHSTKLGEIQNEYYMDILSKGSY